MKHRKVRQVNKKTVAEIYLRGEESLAPLPLTTNFKPNLIMKTSSTFFFFLTAALLAAFSSCKKKDEPAPPPSVDELLTSKAWQITSKYDRIGHDLKTHEENDYWVFYPNGGCAIITGEDAIAGDSVNTKTQPAKKIPRKQTNTASTWTLSEDRKTLITPLVGGNSQITTITKDKLVLTRIIDDNPSITGNPSSSATYQIWTFKLKEGEVAEGAFSLNGDYSAIGNNRKLASQNFNARFSSSTPVTELGFCWAEGNESPTIDSPGNYLAEINLGSTELARCELKKGVDKIKIERGKTYYLRAYAKNSKGTFYSHSAEIWGGN